MALIDQSIIDITPWCIRLQPAAAVSPELQSYQNEKGRIDFGDTDSLNAYNKAALKVMTGLEIDIPEGNLVPTICLRQAYLTVLVEDLLVRGSKILEVGTGASAVIAMIANKIHGLHVTATEIDELSYQSAKANISHNGLDTIHLIKSKGGIIDGVIDPTENFDAVLCYPPTYPEDDRHKYGNSNSTTGFKGTVSEMIGGGKDGYNFISRYLDEAVNANISIISVLLIFKDHATKAKLQLRSLGKKVFSVVLKAGTRQRYLVIAK